RHIFNDNEGRNGVMIRAVTRGAEQKDMQTYLKHQTRFKSDVTAPLCRTEYPLDGAIDESQLAPQDERVIINQIRAQVLQGAYYLIDYRGYAGYEPGDNVVNIFSMGSPTTEAIKASEALLSRGIYANVIVVTSPDLVCGIQGHGNDYQYLKE